ncbi:potentail helicase MOV-10 [Nannizzia gypsea CBS 118893]|uniref:Potentail helicase MOV-10 n=1 Tax=Arthroderma gypseum (strain ATCC MYA-4604 / CBS 118893) TaxID=535722 RepID=E4UXB3_ARTGP|nr:potentail helicase MOV-10 [Nannizzia gypsea CBS 118893]EFR02700.1 potentail helicase MOV-10 [Nannizzia gypsea CBS 118893]
MDHSRPRRAAIPIIDPSGRQVNVVEQLRTTSLNSYRPQFGAISANNARAVSYPTAVSAPVLPLAAQTPNPGANITTGPARFHGPRSQGSLSSWTPHPFAQPYTPAYLLAINRSPAVSKYTVPLKTIDFNAYRQQFAGGLFLEPAPSHAMPPIRSVPISVSLHVKNLVPSSYLYYFDECLLLEAYQQTLDLAQLCLYNVPVALVDLQRRIFEIRVPGLKDDAPAIELGDTVLVRQILHCPNQMTRGVEWLASNQPTLTGSIAPGFNGQQLHSVVVGVSRTKEVIRLRIDHFDMTISSAYSSWLANILFVVQPNRYVPLWEAVTSIENGWNWPQSSPSIPEGCSGNVQDDTNWFRHMLFPESQYGFIQETLPKGVFDLDWVDPDLNYEQMKAVDSIVSRNYGNVPFLISGVPGSGKTKTVVECTLQLLNYSSDVEPHILLCAPSNPAADTLAIRLAYHLKPGEMFRLNGWSRTFAEVPSALLPYTYIDNDLFSLPGFNAMMGYKVVVTTCRDAEMLVKARLTNRDLMKLACETVAAVSPKASVKAQDMLHWTALLIDEAAHDTEPAVCIPLTVVASPLPIHEPTDNKSSLPLFVMAGDHHQLGPRIHNYDTSLSISLFERLFSHPFYADHPLSRRNAGPYIKLVQEMLPIQRPAFTNLTRNYRSHPAILPVPSVLFYSDTLIPCAAPADPNGPVPSWSEWKAPHRWPVLFSCNSSLDKVEELLHRSAGNGVFNPGEAYLALYYVKSLLHHSDQLSKGTSESPSSLAIHPDEIAIITPFRAQVTHLRHVFRSHDLHSVNIGPLEAFQGLETRFLIICTTRTRPGAQFVKQDQSLGLGLVGEKKRFNVALTRAKEGVIVIGNPNVLVDSGKDETWREFLSYCARNGCWATEGSPKLERIGSLLQEYEVGSAQENTNKSARWWANKLAGAYVAADNNNNDNDNDQENNIQDVDDNERGENNNDNHNDNDSTNDTNSADIRLSGYISRLERALLYEEMAKINTGNGTQALENQSALGQGGALHPSTPDDYDSAMWTAGIAAEEVLRGALDI